MSKNVPFDISDGMPEAISEKSYKKKVIGILILACANLQICKTQICKFANLDANLQIWTRICRLSARLISST